MSITLSIPTTVVEDARAYAETLGTSLNAMIRDYLVRLTSRDAKKMEAAKSFRLVADSVSKNMKAGKPYRFNRADAYDREA